MSLQDRLEDYDRIFIDCYKVASSTPGVAGDFFYDLMKEAFSQGYKLGYDDGDEDGYERYGDNHWCESYDSGYTCSSCDYESY